jgi:hypothetical protein
MQLPHIDEASAQAVAAVQQQTTVDGQVTYRRRLSSKLVWCIDKPATSTCSSVAGIYTPDELLFASWQH